MRRFVVIVLAVLVVLDSVSVAMAARTRPVGRATASTNPNPYAEFNDVECVARDSCLAVGGALHRDGRVHNLVERWDGTRWRIVATPSTDSQANVLTKISCATHRFCLALGYRGSDAFHERPTSYVWNGRHWHRRLLPSPGRTDVRSVSCPSARACFAAGVMGGKRALMERFDGHRWTMLPRPDPKHRGQLMAISCGSPARCVIVGRRKLPGGFERYRPLVLVRARHSLHVTALPFARLQVRGELTAVTCVRDGACTALGDGVIPGRGHGSLVATFTHRAWRVKRARPHYTPTDTWLDIACHPALRCVSVNTYQKTALGYQTETLFRRPGEPFRYGPAGGPKGFHTTNGVACVAKGCLYVGGAPPGYAAKQPNRYFDPYQPKGVHAAFVMSGFGRHLHQVFAPSPPGPSHPVSQ